MNAPPPIPAPQPPLIPRPSAGAARAQQMALFSVLAPAVGIGINVAVGPAVHGDRLAMLVVGLAATLLILAGFVLGIVALFSTRKHGRKGILGKAIAGICINGLLIAFMLISIPFLMQAGERAKAIQRQKASEQPVQP